MYKKEEWQEIKKEGKRKHVLFHSTLYRMLPLGVVLIALFEALEKGMSFYRAEGFGSKLLLTAVVFAGIGILVGNLEWWLFNEALQNATEKKAKHLLALVVGVAGFGLPIALVSLIAGVLYGSVIIHFVIWLLGGYVYGRVMTRNYTWNE